MFIASEGRGLYDINDVSDLLWSAQGVTDAILKFRVIPSPGATYPLELLVLVGEGKVVGVSSGVYQYVAKKHALEIVSRGDSRIAVSKYVLDDEERVAVEPAPLAFIVTAVL